MIFFNRQKNRVVEKIEVKPYMDTVFHKRTRIDYLPYGHDKREYDDYVEMRTTGRKVRTGSITLQECFEKSDLLNPKWININELSFPS